MQNKKYLCAVCRSKLPAIPSRSLSGRTHIQLFLITLVFTGIIALLLGPWAGIKSSLIYLPIYMGAEWIQWLRVRDALRCRTCHFDPMLYRRDWKAARKQVEVRMQKFSQDAQDQIRAEIQRLSGKEVAPKPAVASPDISAEKAALETAEQVAKLAREESQSL